MSHEGWQWVKEGWGVIIKRKESKIMKLLLIVKYWNIEWEHKIVSEDVTIHNWRFLCFLVVTQLSLDHFCQLSCQLVNFHKFSIIFSKKITPSWKLSLARHFHMAPTSSLGRYLGIYFNSFQSTIDDFKCILQKAKQRMHNWEACFLPKKRSSYPYPKQLGGSPSLCLLLFSSPSFHCQICWQYASFNFLETTKR